MKKFVIIGGTNGFGKWLANFIKSRFSNLEVVITGRNIERGKKAENEIGARFSTDNLGEVSNADFVVFSAPISLTEDLIKEVGPKIKSGAVVSDVTSIKGFPSKALKKYCPESCVVIPTHPMFGTFVSSIAGQVFVLTPEEKVKQNSNYKFLKDFLNKEGAHVIESTPKEHDKIMSVVQGLTHYSLFTIGETIHRLGLDVKLSQKFVSPIYKLLTSSVSRYMHHDPSLYSDIQMFNDENLKVHKTFMEVSNDFHTFVKEKDKTSFVSTIKKAQVHFKEVAQEGQNYTDKIIFLLSKQKEQISKNIGKLTEFENIYTREKFSGLVDRFDHDLRKIFFKGGKELCSDEWIILS